MLNLDKLTELNHWWKSNAVNPDFNLKYKRKLFFEIQKYLKEKQIISVVGLRRTGKTILLYQLIEYLLEQNIPSKNILYFSFDEKIDALDQVINAYQKNILNKKISEEKCFIFLDEIQKLKNWENQLKYYYDAYPKLKFFISGSASLNLLMKGKESLAGRIYYFNLDLLSFEEFLELKKKNIPEWRKNPVLWKIEIEDELQDYFLKPFPEIVDADDALAKKYIKETVIEKTIYQDVAQLFDIKDLELVEKIIYSISQNPGMVINLDDFSKDFGRSRQLISNYLHYLESCFVLKSLKNFRGSLKVSSRKLKKYYFIHPSIALSISSLSEGKIIENLILSALKPDNFWRENNKEVDFISTDKKDIIPFESKYSENIRERDIKGLLKFLNKYQLKKGYVLTKNMDEEKNIDGKTIIFIPVFRYFLKSEKI